MNYGIILLAAMVLPAVVLFILRANAAIAFLSLCAGSLLLHFMGNQSGLSIEGQSFLPSQDISSNWLQIGILVLPLILSAVFLRKTMKGSGALLNIIPAAAIGVVGALLIVPLLPGGIQANLMGTTVWSLIEQYQKGIVIAGVVVSLVTLWLTHHRPHEKGHKKH